MFDTVFGLPVHALVVHGAVVLLPLAAIGAVVMVAWPRWSRRMGPAVVIVGVIGTVLSVVAKESGEALASRVGTPQPHSELGDRLPAFAAFFAIVLIVFWLLDRGIPGDRRRPAWLTALGVVLVVSAVLVTWWTIRVGHSGAEAVWQSIIDNTRPGQAG